MITLEKLFDVSMVDIVTIPIALLMVALITGGLNVGGVIGVIIGNRIMSVLLK